MARRVSYTVRPVLIVNRGASFGPRVASVTFEASGWEWRKPRLEVAVSADVDGERYQDESAVRRRAGRAAVPIGRAAANKIASGACAATIRLVRRDPDWASSTWIYMETFEGFDRLVRATADFRCDGQHEDHLRLPDGLKDRVAGIARRIADDLHATIDDPDFASIFGGR